MNIAIFYHTTLSVEEDQIHMFATTTSSIWFVHKLFHTNDIYSYLDWKVHLVF
jgi:hypothetical protein